MKIGDLTFNDAAGICYVNTSYFGYCNKECPLKNICGETKHIRIITGSKEQLDQEIEVDEDEKEN
jgi:hypothetical protein